MQTHEKYTIPLFVSDKDEEIKKVYNELKEENYRLQQENEQLKKELEKEQLLHTSLYNEWKELKSGATGKKNNSGKLKRIVVRKRKRFYGLSFIAVVLSAFVIYLLFFNGTDENTVPSPVPTVNQADTPATVKISKKKVERSVHKLPIAYPTNKTRQKRSSIYSLKKDSVPSYKNESVNKSESAGLQKISSTSPVN
jgi:hypothetical protein